MKLFVAALALLAGSMPASAQWLDRSWPDIPRTADGTPDLTAPAPRGPDGHPDLSGVWNGPRPVARLDPDTLMPWVADLASQRQQEYYRTRPAFRCQPSGPETERFGGGWKRFLQTPTALAILNDDLTYRVIHMDGRELEADPAPSWMGSSVGRWDGDTLVVDSFGFNDKTWLSRYGQAHTEALRVRERYRRSDFGHLQVEVTFTDPAAYVKPWGFTAEMTLEADTEMLESVCERGSQDWDGTLSDAANRAVSVPPDVLARYIGVYTGTYLGFDRTIEVSLSGGQLIARVVGAARVDGGEIRPLVPRSHTMFEGAGLGYEFIVDDKGVATEVVEIKVSGRHRYPRKP